MSVNRSAPFLTCRSQSENYANQLFKLAGQEGLEPPTCGFGDRCSAKLSYWPLSRLAPYLPFGRRADIPPRATLTIG